MKSLTDVFPGDCFPDLNICWLLGALVWHARTITNPGSVVEVKGLRSEAKLSRYPAPPTSPALALPVWPQSKHLPSLGPSFLIRTTRVVTEPVPYSQLVTGAVILLVVSMER